VVCVFKGVSVIVVSLRSTVAIDRMSVKSVPVTPEALYTRYSYGPAAGMVSSLSGFFHAMNIEPPSWSVFVTLTFLMTGTPDTRLDEISFEALLSVPLG
jgi:hypothetical protein